MNPKSTILAAVVALVAAGCSGNPRCGEPGPYMAASPRPPLTVPEGLDAPDPSRRMTIPSGADVVHPELRGRTVVNPDGSLRCLESPPPLRETTPAVH